MVLLTTQVIGQNFTNGNFETSISCSLTDCEDIEIACIEDWWTWNSIGPNDAAWISYDCFSSLVDLEGCTVGERGGWLQTGSAGGGPLNNPQKLVTDNPYFGENPNGVYQMEFDFIPFPSENNPNLIVNVYGSHFATATNGTLNFLQQTTMEMSGSTPVTDCFHHTIYFNKQSDEFCNHIDAVTDYEFLIFEVDFETPPSPEPEVDNFTNGVLDNVSMCKLIEFIVQDDCEKPCIEINYNEECFIPPCNVEDCSIQVLITGDVSESFAYDDQPWEDHIDCFEIEAEDEVEIHYLVYFGPDPVSLASCFRYEFNDCESLTIVQNTTWSISSPPPYDHFNEVVVETGFILTIESEIELYFCETGRLVIEPGATVNLYGALTSDCHLGWQGVEVQGNGNSNQFPSGGFYPQGVLNCFENSRIENALVAVKLWGPNYGDAGGQIYADGAHFVNNSQGLYFAPFNNYFINSTKPRPYFSKIRNCTFLTNNNYTLEAPFIYNVYTNGTRGLDFRGCDFLNFQNKPEALDATSLGIGILAMDSQFDIGPSADNPGNEPCSINECEKQTVFNGLGTGVEIGRIGRNKPFQIYNSLFENCNFGIVNKAVSGGKILFNEFKLGSLKPFDGNMDQIGIAMSGYLASADVQENEFSFTDDNVGFTLGIMVEQIGDENIAIRKNYFEGLSVSNEAIGLNAGNRLDIGSGLYYLCNENENISMKDFYFPDSDYPNDYIRRIQGLIDEGGLFSTGNRFSNSGDSDGDFANYCDGTVLFDPDVVYYYYDIFDPIDYPDDYAGIDGRQDQDENTCLSGPRLHPHIPDEEDFDIAVADYYSYIDDFWVAVDEEDEEAAIAFRVMMDKTIDDITRFIDYDTSNFIRDTLRNWYARDSSIVGQLQLAGDFFDAGEDEDMSDILNAMPYMFDLNDDESLDIERIERVYNILLDRGLALNEADFDTLYLYASLLGHASVLAKNVLASVLDTFFLPKYYVPGEISPRNENFGSFTNSLSAVNIYPNPAKNELTILLNNKTFNGTIHFYDTFGKLVLTNNLGNQLNKVNLDSKLNAGIYFYTIFDRSNVIVQGILIIQN